MFANQRLNEDFLILYEEVTSKNCVIRDNEYVAKVRFSNHPNFDIKNNVLEVLEDTKIIELFSKDFNKKYRIRHIIEPKSETVFIDFLDKLARTNDSCYPYRKLFEYLLSASTIIYDNTMVIELCHTHIEELVGFKVKIPK